MVADIFRDSAIGNLLNYASNGKLFPFADQRSDYVVPARYLPKSATPSPASSARTHAEGSPDKRDDETLIGVAVSLKNKEGKELDLSALEASPENLTPEQVEAYPFLVTWEENDADKPHNWSSKKRIFSAGLIMLLTASVYIGSAIYTSSIPGIEQRFGVAPVVATLGLSLFVGGYGIGPMFLGPLQDVVSIGRTPIYIVGLFLFVLFQVPVIFAPNIGTILVFRFFAGVVASPALSTGATSMTELFSMDYWAYAIGLWTVGATCGPVFEPVVGGFAAQANGWRWPIYELLWISGFALLLLSLLLPETSEKTILYRRAIRLRKLTGNALIKSQHELDAGDDVSILRSVRDNFVVGLKVAGDPAVGFANVYIALVYAIFYLWFETFPVVFNDFYHFNEGVSGLAYLGFVVAAIVTFTFYALYNKIHMNPRIASGDVAPENRLELGILAGCFIPVSLLMFGWGAHAHWMVPIVGAALYFPGLYLLGQSVLMFVSMYVKPQFNSSVMASNCLFRSSLAAAFPLFGRRFVLALGVGGACSLLAGVSALMVPVLWLLRKKGAELRRKSKWANTFE